MRMNDLNQYCAISCFIPQYTNRTKKYCYWIIDIFWNETMKISMCVYNINIQIYNNANKTKLTITHSMNHEMICKISLL